MRNRMRFNHFKIIILSLAFLTIAMPALAQITQTARVELTDEQTKTSLGSNVYITKDPEHRLTADIIGMRHENNLRGERYDSDIVNLGTVSVPTWLTFSVTNNSGSEDWILYFGSPTEGRMGLVHKLVVTDYTNHQTFIESMRELGAGQNGEDLQGAALPIKIARGKTALFVVYVEMESGYPNTLAPSLMTPRAYATLARNGDLLENLMQAFLVACAALFAWMSYLYKDRAYAYFAYYFLLSLAIFAILNESFFATSDFIGATLIGLQAGALICGLIATRLFLNIGGAEHTENTLIIGAGMFAGISSLLSIVIPDKSTSLDDWLAYLPQIVCAIGLAALCFLQGQQGKPGGLFCAAAWAFCAFGLLVSGLSYAGFLNANAYNIDAYWLCLIPQAAFLLTATTKKIEFQRIEERAVEARESRAQNSLARLKQSKESADQARLLRVIERERELMAELREREMQRTDEMRKAKDMADHANQAKSAFLAVVSHEIRTPMTGIMGILRLFKDTKLSRDQADYLFAIQKSGDTMMALLNDILDFEKIESGNMQLEHIDFDLPRLAQGVMTLMSGHAATKNLNLKADIAEDFPRSLRGDPTRLRQVLLNLVNNAIKFTEKGDVTIRLRATKRDKTAAIKGDYEVYIAVEDMGIGISEEAQVKLFTPFQQADSSVARKYGGTGLGLAICQRLVEAMGSAIRLTSATGKGSTFFFTLLMEKGKAETIEENEGAIAANVEKTPSKNILVIEDNDINRKVMQNFLEKDGHRITAIAGGEEAADLCMANKFDVILMDINLNGMSGFETIKTIRALPDRQKANAPIIAITGNTLQAEIEEILNAGFNDYLSKPIDFDRLLEMIGDAHKGKYAQTSAEQTSAPTAVKSFESFEDYDDFDLDEDSFTVAENFLNKPAEQSSKPNDDSVFNVQMMDKLKKSLGKEQMDQLMFGFVEKSDEIVQALGEDIKATNIESIRDRAHELKGMGGNFGLSELSKIAGEIEKACKNNDMSVVAAQIQKLPAANARAKDAIKNWLS